MAKVYKLTTLDKDTDKEVFTSWMTFSALLDEVHKMAGREDKFFLVKVPEVGAPTEIQYESIDQAKDVIAQHMAGESGELLLYCGEKIEIGQIQQMIPIKIGTEEILVAAKMPDPPPPEEAPPQEDAQPSS